MSDIKTTPSLKLRKGRLRPSTPFALDFVVFMAGWLIIYKIPDETYMLYYHPIFIIAIQKLGRHFAPFLPLVKKRDLQKKELC